MTLLHSELDKTAVAAVGQAGKKKAPIVHFFLEHGGGGT